jgi:signal transduction histidine kinase/HD-GYP domain-containing protein (c-di-GMP phosphodiesterase class II)
MVAYGKAEESAKHPALSIQQIRAIELVTIFFIVFIAREIAGFSYRTGLVISVFLGAAFLNLLVAGLENSVSVGSRGTARARSLWRWVTVLIDCSTALALIYLTGSTESPFLFLLVIPLFFAGRLLPPVSAGMTVTIASVASLAIFALLEMRGIIPHFNCYPTEPSTPAEGNYVVGTLLIVGGFMALMTYLFSSYFENFNVYVRTAEDRILSSRKRILELTRLYDISLGINSVISLDTLLKMVCKEITLLLRRPWVSVILFNQKREVVEHVELGSRGNLALEPSTPLAADPLIVEAGAREDGLIIDDVRGHSAASTSPLIAGRKLVSVLVVPIYSGKDNLGMLMVGDMEAEPFSPEDARLLTILSGQVAMAIEKSRLYEVMSGRIERLGQENEDLRASNKLKMNYLSHLSHELKTPLTSIKAYVESVVDHMDDPDFPEKKEFLGIITSETERLIRMVNKVLDVSKIEFGNRTLRRKLFRLAPLLAEVESSIQPYLRDKRLRLSISVPANLPLIDGDEDLVKQVFINLISNAVKFSPSGSRIAVEAVEDAVAVKVTVTDEGVGIPPEDLQNIFKQFYQVRRGSSEGVGLGLAIVKNIVEQHGGYITVASRLGEGSTFIFTLPKEHHFNDLLGYLFDSIDAREEIQEMFQLAVKVIAEMLSAKIVSLMLLDQEKKELFIKVAYGLDENIVAHARARLGAGIAGRVAESGEPLLVENVEASGFKNAPSSPQYETKSLVSVPLKVGSSVVGVINANNKTSGKPFNNDDLSLLVSLSQRFSKVIERIRTAENAVSFLRETILSLRSLLASQEQGSRGVARKTVQWSVQVARKLRLSEKEVQVIQYVSSVHDVGMTCVSEEILKKTLELSPQEMEEIKKHPQRGAAIMRPLEFVELVSQSILFHHERIDGKGYPMGLRGDQIPIGSRILSVLDAYASMVSERPFRARMTPLEAVDELVRHSGGQFDPRVIAAFVEVLVDENELEVDDFTRITDALRNAKKHHLVP